MLSQYIWPYYEKMQDATKTNVDPIVCQIRLTSELICDIVHESIKTSKLNKCISNVNDINLV